MAKLQKKIGHDGVIPNKIGRNGVIAKRIGRDSVIGRKLRRLSGMNGLMSGQNMFLPHIHAFFIRKIIMLLGLDFLKIFGKF